MRMSDKWNCMSASSCYNLRYAFLLNESNDLWWLVSLARNEEACHLCLCPLTEDYEDLQQLFILLSPTVTKREEPHLQNFLPQDWLPQYSVYSAESNIASYLVREAVLLCFLSLLDHLLVPFSGTGPNLKLQVSEIIKWELWALPSKHLMNKLWRIS